MLVEGMDFRQALEHLARKAGVELQQFSRGDGRLAQRKKRAREALQLAARYYQQVLIKTPEARDYVVKRRGLNRATIEEFTIGFAPEGQSTVVDVLKKRGFSQQELQDAGLTNRFGGDLFRSRMMVALSDGAGEVVGFTGRIIVDDPKAPKYLNTPQTLLFDKSRHIFGLAQAKEAIRKENVAVVVEGNLDVVSSHQAGVKQVVATAGTAMTEQHLKTLSRLAERIKLSFDGDRAGLAATERAIDIAQRVGVEVEVVTLPGAAKDPDELIQQGAELWRSAIDNSQPAVEWVIDQYKAREDVTTAEGKRRFTTASLRLVGRLQDPVEREHYMELLAGATGASLSALEQKMASTVAVEAPKRRVNVEKIAATPVSQELEDTVIALALAYPQARHWLASLTEDMVEQEATKELLLYLQQNQTTTLDTLPKQLQKYEQYVKIVQLKSDVRYANWEDSEYQAEMAHTVKQVLTKHRETKKQRLIEQLRDAEAANDDARAESLRRDINALIKEKQ
jgi:DNA primase